MSKQSVHKAVPLVFLISAFCLLERTLKAVEFWEPAETHAVIIGVTRWEADLSKYSRRHRKDEELQYLEKDEKSICQIH